MKRPPVSTFVVQTPPTFWRCAVVCQAETGDGLVGWGETAILAALHTLEDSYELVASFEAYLKAAILWPRSALPQNV